MKTKRLARKLKVGAIPKPKPTQAVTLAQVT